MTRTREQHLVELVSSDGSAIGDATVDEAHRAPGRLHRAFSVLLVSADLEELIGMSDSLYVMLRGALVAKLDPSSVTPEQLGSYMTGAALSEEVQQ